MDGWLYMDYFKNVLDVFCKDDDNCNCLIVGYNV